MHRLYRDVLAFLLGVTVPLLLVPVQLFIR